MSENEIEYVLSQTDSSRRTFLGRLLAGAAFAAPAVASFTIGRGSSAARRAPLVNDAGSNSLPPLEACGPNAIFGGYSPTYGSNIGLDLGSNSYCIWNDGGSNLDGGGNLDGGSNDLDGGSNTGDGNSLPPTK